MKPSPTIAEMSDVAEIRSTGDLRRFLGNALLGIGRKEVSATDAMAMAKVAAEINNTMNNEIKVARLDIDLRKTGQKLVETSEFGKLMIG